MAISKARKRFRVFLGMMLALSLGFFCTAAFFYIGLKQKRIKMADMAPALFQIDIYQYQALAMLSSDDEKLRIGKSLIQKGVFDPVYGKAGKEMIEELAENGHAPSQKTYADIIYMRMETSAEHRTLAMDYYKKSADQGYKPAQERLAELAKADTIATGDTRP